jgi:hypothetical protein
MAAYWVTFRIAERTVSGRDDDDRREALYEAIRKRVEGNKWWREPTSFVLFNSASGIADLASAIKQAVAPDYDVVLIRAAETKDARVIGPVDKDLFDLMPYVQRT